jgi:hypothetical protein
VKTGVGLQDRGEHHAVTAADVDDLGEAAPVEAFGDLRRLHLEPPVHLRVERAPQLRVCVQVRPEFAPVAPHVAGCARGDRLEQFDEPELGAPARGVDVEQGLDPLRGVLAHLCAEFGGAVGAGPRVTVEDTDRDQVLEQASQGRRGGSGGRGELLGRCSRTPRELHEAERRGHTDGHGGSQIGQRPDRGWFHRSNLFTRPAPKPWSTAGGR